MKYLKTYKNKDKPQIGDYVIMKSKFKFKPELTEFIENTIGKIYNMSYNPSEITTINEIIGMYITVIYDWVPEHIRNYNFTMVQGGFIMYYKYNYIYEYAKTKKELKLKIASKKYNI